MQILILDKSSIVRTKIVTLLEDIDADIDTNEFENGDEAFEFISSNKVDLVFSAIETEGMDGVTFVDLVIRNNPKLISKIFIVTSQKNTEKFADIKDVGAKRFIRKPINEEFFKHFIVPEIIKICGE